MDRIFARGRRVFALGLCLGFVGLVGSCHDKADGEPFEPIARAIPARVSNAEAWRLFDRSVSSGFTPTADPVTLELERSETIVAIKVRGPSPYVLDVRGEKGASLGFASIDLSTGATGWRAFLAANRLPTKHVELRFRALGASQPVPEVELWVDDQAQSGGSRSLTFASPDTTGPLAPGQCTSFAVNVDRHPAVFRRIELAYESTGAVRPFVLERGINGRALQGGTWLDGSALTSSTLREQVDPSHLILGKNEVRLCVPRAATRSVTIEKLRITGELDRGVELAIKATLSDERDASALIDEKTDTSIAVRANERVVLDFDRLIAPDALVLDPYVAPQRVECIAKNGGTLELGTEDAEEALRIDGAQKACRAVAVTFESALTLTSLDVIGSGAEESVDWPRIVLTSTREHFGNRAWISGFVARPPAMTGAIRTQVAGLATEAKTGDFSRLVERTNSSGTWTVDVDASFPDGTQQNQKIVLAEDRGGDLVESQTAAALTAQSNDLRFGKIGATTAVQASRTTATKVRLGSLVGLDIPAGAVNQRTTIKAKHLDHDDLPPLEPGMINVTAPKGHAYEFLPHGQRFAKAVDVVVPFDAALIPQGMTINDVYTYYFDSKARRWKKLQRSAIDLGDHTTRSTTDHFTIMINAVLATPTNPKPLSSDPTSAGAVAAASPTANIDFVAPPVANSTGDARLSLPIRIPAGRGRYSPALALAYSSSATNGWLGVGWDLPISRIEIDTRWGVPTYLTTEEPRYLLDGAELVRTPEIEGPTCTNGQRYHLRVEGAFSHVLRCGTNPSNYYWEVRDRSGTVYTYGGTSSSVLASYRPPFGVFRWNLRDVTDVHGNKATFTYSLDEIAAGPAPNGQEASRESYISSIEYSQHASLTGKYRVDFVRDNGARTDRIISGRAGFKVVTRHLLRQIRVSLNDGSGLSTIREYVLTYSHGQFGKAVLATVGVYGTSGCTPGLDAFAAPTSCAGSFFHDHRFTYYGESDGLSGFSAPTAWLMVDDPNPAKATIVKGDSTSKSGSLSLSVSDGTSSATLGASGTSGERSEPIGLYDVNGDGLVDQVFEQKNWINGSDELLVLYNQFNKTPTGDRSFSPLGTVSGATKLGHESHRSWSVDAKVGIKTKGFGASASGGYSNAKSSADKITTDFDGDGFIDQISTSPNGTMRSEPCPSGQCFTPATFDATSFIDPKLDPALIETEAEVSDRLMLGDPVVQWVAPYDGTLTLVAQAQRRHDIGGDGVTLELYQRVVGVSPTQDVLAASYLLQADNPDPVSLALPNIPVVAGQQFYMRIRTGNPDIDKTGQLNDELDAWMTADYSTACSNGTCFPVPAVQPRDPTNKQIYSFSQILDSRVNGTKPLAIPSDGTVRVRGQLIKSARSAAPIRFCLQRFPLQTTASNGSFDLPCSSTAATNLSTTYSFTEAAVTSYSIDVSTAVSVGQSLVLRVESDFSIDPSVMTFVPFADQPLAEYTQVCTPSSGGQTSCSTLPLQIAQVPLELGAFGLFFAPVSPPTPLGAIPWATRSTSNSTWSISVFENPLYPTPITVTIRSNTRGTLKAFTCTAVRTTCGRYTSLGEIPPTTPFAVNNGESISFEITATNVTNAGNGLLIPGSFGNVVEVPAFFRKSTATPQARTPFVDARHGFSVTFWNENEPFQPSLLLEDYASLNTSMPPDVTRLEEMMRSAVEPLPYSYNPLGYAVGYPATAPAPTWAAPGSVAFMTPLGHANAADVGVMQDNASGASSVFGGSYARLSCTRSYYLGVGITGSPGLHGIELAGSLNGTVGSSHTKTTTDVLDLTGDGIADVLAGDSMYISTLVNGGVRSVQNLGIGVLGFNTGFRRRTSQDYSFGFGGSASFPLTTSGGRRRSMGSQDVPEPTVGLSDSEGFSVGRSHTSHDLVDVNGDGLPDLVERNGVTINVRYNLGDRFDNWTSFGTLDASLSDTQIDLFQGFEDVEPVHGEQLLKTNQNALSHETTITQNRTYSVDFYVASASYSTKTTSSRVTRQFADLNGDGLPDLLLKKAGESFIRVQYNTGGSFAPATTWTTPAWQGTVFPAFSTTTYASLFTGANAVGGPDVLAGMGTQDSTAFSGSVSIPIYAKVSVGLGGSVAYEKDTYELGLVDVTGDGAVDHVLRRGESNDPESTYVKENRADGRSNLIKKITGPLGGEISLEYQLAGSTVDMPQSRQVLSKVTVDDKSPAALEPNYASPNLVTQYSYGGGYYDRLEKTFFGFGTVTTTRADGQVVEQTYENHDFTLHGSPIQTTRMASASGATLHKQLITRQLRTVVDANGTPLVPDTTCLNNLHALLRRLGTAACTPKFAVVTKDEETRYEGAANKTRTIEDLSFDRFGNVLESLDRADDALTTDDVYSSVAYQHDTTRWFLGLPTSLQVRAGNASGTLLRSRRGLYNINGQPYQLEVDTGTSPAIATTNLTYDAYGNLETLSTPVNEQGARQVYTLAYDPTIKTFVTSTLDAFGYQSQSTYDLRFGVATTNTDLNGASSIQTLDAFGRLSTVRGPYDTQTGDGVTLSYFHLESPPRASSVTKATKPAGTTGTPPPAIRVETITNGLGEAIELRKTGVVDAVAGVITSGLIQRDNLGRVTRTFQPFFTAGTSSTGFITPTSTPYIESQYDALDRATVTTYPDTATETVSYAIQSTSTGASLFRVQASDTDNHQRVTFHDHLGRTREFEEYPNASAVLTKYDYAATGELTQITDAGNNITTLGYDLRGLRTSLRNPDTGLITDTFDAMGNRISMQEPNHRRNGVSVQFKYNRDRLERVIYPAKPAIRTCASGLTGSVCYEYGDAGGDPNARGRLTRVQDESGNQVHTYGLLGEIRETVRTVAPPSTAAVVFDHRYVWDSLGHLLSLRYPDGETVSNTYDESGNLKQVDGLTFNRNYASDIRYDVFGNRTRLKYGNNVQSTWTYDYNRVRLVGVSTTLPNSRPIQALTYSYTNNNRGQNFAGIANGIQPIVNTDATNTPGPSTLTFTYDGVDRLLTVSGEAQLNASKTTSYDEVFTYSTTHNLLSKQRVRREFQTGTTNYSYAPDQQIDRCSNPPCNAASYTYATNWDAACNGGDTGVRPHLPNQVGTSNFGVQLQYDCSGNPVVRQKSDTGSTQLLTWDDDGRLTDTQEAGAQQHNTFDAGGTRVRRASSGGGQNNVTIYSSEYFDLDGNTQGARHVFAGNLRVATELSSFASSSNPPAPTAEGTRYFFHTDHLGSTTVITDQSPTNPAVYQSTEYYVDGDEWLDRAPQTATNQYLFNGKPFDKDTGFYDYGQRFYDPRTSLWLGTDPALTDSAAIAIGNPRMLSPLGFSAHNPTRYVDPDGRFPIVIPVILGLLATTETLEEDRPSTLTTMRRATMGIIGGRLITSAGGLGVGAARKLGARGLGGLAISGAAAGVITQAGLDLARDKASDFGTYEDAALVGATLGMGLGLLGKGADSIAKRLAPVPGQTSGIMSEGFSRVGRWMSPRELAAMQSTGRVQAGTGGAHRVTFPADASAYKAAKPGNVFVTYDVPTSSLRSAGTEGWRQIAGPDSVFGRLAARNGQPLPELPTFRNLKVEQSK